MSHLPLDARAILDYLNELGYRNISAEQLKEFMKGMQSQSEIYKSKLKEKNSNSRLQQQQQQQPQQQPQQQLQRLEPQQQQQQQQQQPQVRSTTSANTKSTAAEGTEAAVAGVGKSTPLPQRRATVKVIKCKKPLCHFKFYLDIWDHNLTKRIEEQIRALGGSLEFFLTWNVTHFITDKTILPPILPPIIGNNNNNSSNNNNSLSSRPDTPQTPGTPNTPQTPYSIDAQDGKNNASGDNTTPTSGTAKKPNTRQTRANAILNRVRRASTTTNNALNVNAVSVNERANSPATASVSNQSKDVAIPSSFVLTQCPYIVWQTEYALHFFKKVQHELRDYLGTNSRHDQHKLLNKGRSAAEPIDLKGGGYLKIEAVKHNYRPYYQLFRKSSGSEWPKIELTREDGAFRLIPKKKIIPNTVDSIVEAQEKAKASRVNEEQKMTRKSRSRSSQHQRPQHAAVQSLKKGAGGGATGSAATNKSSQRNSQAGVIAGGVAATACKQVKESSDKQCGVCEICKIEYDTLTIHLKTKDHEYFAKNSQNFIALDSLIHTSADVNKFLNEDKKVDLEEMEVENIEVIADANEADPLEGSEPLMAMPLLELSDDKRRLGGVQQQTPSPTLREKSKRTTKGKHSSEKFQNLRLSKSPKATATATAVKSQTSPLKQQVPLATATSSMLELQRIETNANVSQQLSLPNVTTAVTTRRKPISATAVSPPIRAMLPPSSLYKVVGTPEAICTPTRKTRGDLLAAGDQAVGASPSLIVKFKKVRAAELDRLNGEAENFMFPKQRTSSELPTDIDRHTTSDNARANFSSASLDSISDDGPMEVELADASEHSEKSTREKKMGKRAIANAKRRKSQSATGTKQRFPIAPIQPELQLKDKQSSHKSVSAKSAELSTVGKKVNEATTKPAISAAAAKANAAAAVLAAITLPEATRKSSRTATAIVTAATTSSRLLRAAVEAAKHNYRQMAAANDLVSNGRKKSNANEAATKSLPEATVTKTRGSVVKMEDRMGDAECMNNDKSEEESEDDAESTSTSSSSGSENEDEKNEDDGKAVKSRYFIDDVDDDEDDDDDEDVDDDDENDEDYVHCKSRRRKTITYDTPPAMWQDSCSGAKSRMQRALQREEQKSKQLIVPLTENEIGRGRGGKRKKSSDEQIKSKALKVAVVSKDVKNVSTESLSRTPSPLKQKSTTANFDYANSERLNQMRYSFERVPVGDIWHRVFTRQDNYAERYFEYYGSTNYRKLPYELGPIPFAHTLDSNTCCKLCEKQRTTNFASKSAARDFLNADIVKVKSEPIEESEGGATKSRDSSSCNSIDVANATNAYAMGNAVNVQSEPCAPQFKHKHKKLQILQRYQQEQQELQKRQAEQAAAQLHNSSNQLQCDTKASIPVQERARDRQRAGSTHSTTSSTSCASSTATTKTSKNRYLNKHLNKAAAAFLNLELPPRKSPREHASTLALVSCIIKQRQDSQSKPNSETDEPSTTPTPMSVAETAVKSNGTELTSVVNAAAASKAQRGAAAGLSADSSCSAKASPIATDLPVLRSPRHTRSAAVTPVEELRFTTEISENVKRMRRGQNKYDHSPPVALSQTRKSGRGGRQSISSPMGRPRGSYSGIQKFLHSTGRSASRMSQTPNSLIAAAVTTGKRHRRGYNVRRHNSYSGLLAQGSAIPSIRKTGSKKGVLEFEVDTNALKALDTATKHKSVHQLEWQIDKYLQYHASEYDLEEDFTIGILENGDTMPLPAMNPSSKKNSTTIGSSSASTSNAGARRIDSANNGARSNAAAPFYTNTPPPTDCFSSDFDLYDLFTNATCGSGTDDDQASNADRKRKGVGLSLYNSLSMQKYFRKRKNLKSNRTGWPKVQKKKTSARQQQILARKIRFLQDIGELTGDGVKEEPEDNKEDGNEQDNGVPVKSKCVQRRRRNGVITPPESEDEVKRVYENGTMQNEGIEDEDAVMDDDTELDAVDSIPEEEDEEDDDDDDEDIEDDGETMADSIDGEAVPAEPNPDADADAAIEADEEDAEEAELEADAAGTPGEDDEDEDDGGDNSNFPTTRNRISRRHTNATPIEEEKLATTNSLTARGCNTNSTGATSTPSTQMLRGSLRRTPQLLNGSLGSCISPSEKAGDNSDIFTVSSDGLDTDLDMSNSQHKCDDEHLHHTNHHHHSLHHHTQEQCANHQTPKRKFDLSKYAPNNATSSSCAAEAATAAVKSLAISQFLKKEVRVTCRRLRAPFRRYRYRR